MQPARLSSVLARVLTGALLELADAAWPLRCRLCGAHAPDALACALHALPDGPPGARCGRCLAPLSAGVPDGERCAGCRRQPPGWQRLVALGDYRTQPVLREWLLAFKHGGRPGLSLPLGVALGRRALACGVGASGDETLLVPVPLHPVRRLERGYDQAFLLAQEVARATGLPLVRALRRRRDTRVQGASGSISRPANVRDAFAGRRTAARAVVGRSAWLVDDVVTSGSTARECARVLRGLGAGPVGVLAIARAADQA